MYYLFFFYTSERRGFVHVEVAEQPPADFPYEVIAEFTPGTLSSADAPKSSECNKCDLPDIKPQSASRKSWKSKVEEMTTTNLSDENKLCQWEIKKSKLQCKYLKMKIKCLKLKVPGCDTSSSGEEEFFGCHNTSNILLGDCRTLHHIAYSVAKRI